MKKPIVFTDLDGTLLDYSNYSFEKTLPALEILRQKTFPSSSVQAKLKRDRVL